MNNEQTPAQKAGFIVDVTRLKISNTEHARFGEGLVWILKYDDRTNLPFFKSECGKAPNECFFVSDLSIIADEVPAAPIGPKFPVGSYVKVVDSGWGFGPEMIGTVLTVVDFTLRGSEQTTYHVADSEGQRRGGDIWEPSFELVVPEPTAANIPELPTEIVNVVPPLPTVYSMLQRKAVDTFQGMFDAAVAHREGRESRLNGDCGICDNIDRFATAAGASESQMAEVKENLIRATAMYSGNYNYPVPCPDGGDASTAFNRHSKKWLGDYGLNRLTQLGQMVDLIKSDKWSDDMVERKTPAFRNGLQVGDIVRYTRRDTPSFWVFRRDDGSMSPSFHKLTDKDDYTDIDLTYIVKVGKDEAFKERPVSEFLSEIAEQVAKKADIERQIAELKAALQTVESAVGLLDFGLAHQHKVKRI